MKLVFGNTGANWTTLGETGHTGFLDEESQLFHLSFGGLFFRLVRFHCACVVRPARTISMHSVALCGLMGRKTARTKKLVLWGPCAADRRKPFHSASRTA